MIYGSGSGAPPSENATVTLHYNVWSTTGELYQSTQANNAPLSLKVGDLQPEWKAVVLQMQAGQRASIWHLAEPSSFQQQGQPSLLHELTDVFDGRERVDLLDHSQRQTIINSMYTLFCTSRCLSQPEIQRLAPLRPQYDKNGLIGLILQLRVGNPPHVFSVDLL